MPHSMAVHTEQAKLRVITSGYTRAGSAQFLVQPLITAEQETMQKQV